MAGQAALDIVVIGDGREPLSDWLDNRWLPMDSRRNHFKGPRLNRRRLNGQ